MAATLSDPQFTSRTKGPRYNGRARRCLPPLGGIGLSTPRRPSAGRRWTISIAAVVCAPPPCCEGLQPVALFSFHSPQRLRMARQLAPPTPPDRSLSRSLVVGDYTIIRASVNWGWSRQCTGHGGGESDGTPWITAPPNGPTASRPRSSKPASWITANSYHSFSTAQSSNLGALSIRRPHIWVKEGPSRLLESRLCG